MDAWEALLLERKEDDGLPCYHLMEKYSTDVLGLLDHPALGFLLEKGRYSLESACAVHDHG
jgi:hypothetical protein